MIKLEKFFETEPKFNSKLIKQANQIIHLAAQEDIKGFNQSIIQILSKYILPEQLCNNLSRYLNTEEALCMISDEIKKNFWDSQEPNFKFLINCANISKSPTIFTKNEDSLIRILSNSIYGLPEKIILSLLPILDLFIRHVTYDHVEIPFELIQMCDDAFEAGSTATIISTIILRLSDRPFSISTISSMHEFIIKCISSVFDKNKLGEIRQNTSQFLSLAMPGERYILLQSFFAKEMQSDQFLVALFNKIKSILNTSSNPSVLAYIYASLVNILNVTMFEEIKVFLIRDYDTSSDEVRASLNALFDKMMEIDAKATITSLSPQMLQLKWHSKTKRALFPPMLKFASKLMMIDFIELAQDQLSKILISQCLSNIKQSKDSVSLLVEVISEIFGSIDEEKTLLTFEHIFKAENSLIPLVLNKLPSNEYGRHSIILDAIITSPKTNIKMKESMEFARRSGNWDFLTKSIMAFNAVGLPFDQNDIESFIETLPNLLILDSPNHQALIIRSIDELAQRLKNQQKKYSTIETKIFLQRIIDIASEKLVLSQIQMQQSFGLEICCAIWKSFPDVLNEQISIKLNALLKHGSQSMQVSVLKAMKLLKIDIHNNEKEKLNLYLSDFPAEIDLNNLQQFKLRLQNKDTIIDESFVELIQRLIDFESQSWKIQSEIYQILVSIILQLEHKDTISDEIIEKVAYHIFSHLMDTRKVGLICSCVNSLEKIVHLLFSTKFSNKPKEYGQTLINQLSAYDMAQMRRSAGLPYICMSLIRAETPKTDLFFDLTMALIMLLEKTDNPTEATNSLNVLKSIIKEHELTDDLVSKLLKSIIDSCNKFAPNWDVVSAVDLTIVALLHKVWEMLADETKFRSLSRYKFMNRIPQAKESIVSSLESDKPHSNYLGLMILSMFPSDAGDQGLLSSVLKHRTSKSSRIRRTAARAAISLIPINQREVYFVDIMNKLDSKQMNAFHFDLMLLNMIKENGVCHQFVTKFDISTLPNMCKKIIYELNNSTAKSESILETIQSIKDQNVSESLLKKIISDLISTNLLQENKTYQLVGLRFLAKHLKANSFDGSILIELIPKVTSIELKAALINMIQFSNPMDISPLIPLFIEMSLNMSEQMVPIHLALSNIVYEIIKCQTGYSVVLLLLLNDIPKVRIQTSLNLSGHLLNIQTLVKMVLEKMSNSEKLAIGSKWIDIVYSRRDTDQYGEPALVLVDEFLIGYLTIPGLKEEYLKGLNQNESLFDARTRYCTIAKSILPQSS